MSRDHLPATISLRVKRLRRIIVNVLAAFSLFLCLTTLTFWIWTHHKLAYLQLSRYDLSDGYPVSSRYLSLASTLSELEFSRSWLDETQLKSVSLTRSTNVTL